MGQFGWSHFFLWSFYLHLLQQIKPVFATTTSYPFSQCSCFLLSVNSLNLSLDLDTVSSLWEGSSLDLLFLSNLNVLELFDYTPHSSKKERSRTFKASNRIWLVLSMLIYTTSCCTVEHAKQAQPHFQKSRTGKEQEGNWGDILLNLKGKSMLKFSKEARWNRSLVINNHPAYFFLYWRPHSSYTSAWEGGISSPEACKAGSMPLATTSDFDLLPDPSVSSPVKCTI